MPQQRRRIVTAAHRAPAAIKVVRHTRRGREH
jgi:hypothetical protein